MSEQPRQLDLFADSDRNQQLHAFGVALLEAPEQAAAVLERLRALPGLDGACLRDCGELLRARTDRQLLLRDPPAAKQYLDGRLQELARHCLDPVTADHYLRLLRRQLAQALMGRVWDPQSQQPHAAQLWLQCEQPQLAVDSIELDPDWRHCARRLLWYAQAGEQLHAVAVALRAWLRLVQVDAQLAEQMLEQSRLLASAWEAFADLEPPLPIRWFGLWLELTGTVVLPALEGWLDDDEAARLLCEVQPTRPAQRAEAAFRTRLSATCPLLLKHWLARSRR